MLFNNCDAESLEHTAKTTNKDKASIKTLHHIQNTRMVAEDIIDKLSSKTSSTLTPSSTFTPVADTAMDMDYDDGEQPLLPVKIYFRNPAYVPWNI